MTKMSASEAMGLVQDALGYLFDHNHEDVLKAVDALVEIQNAGIQESAQSDRFLHIGGAKVHAYFHLRSESRFVILAENAGAVHPWVVAYVRNLSNSEWDSGQHVATYKRAVNLYTMKVNKQLTGVSE